MVFDLARVTLKGFFDVKELEEDTTEDEVVLHPIENSNMSAKVHIGVSIGSMRGRQRTLS